MENQLPFAFSSRELRRDLRSRTAFNDHVRPTLVPDANSTPQNESSRYLSLLSRFCNDEHFANTVDEWNDFKIPQRKDEIRQAAHFAPPACSFHQLRHASHNSMQRWVYRILTLDRSRIEPDMPICVSHTMALQELVAWWNLDGSQFCRLNARAELVDPTQAHGEVWIGSCRFARQTMCDMLWLELCNLRGEWHSIERASRSTQAHEAEYMQPSQDNWQLSAAAYQRASREPHSSMPTAATQVSHAKHKTTDALQLEPDGHHVNYFADSGCSSPSRPNNHVATNQRSSSCATPSGWSETVDLDTQPPDQMYPFSHQHDTEQEKSMGYNGERICIERDGNPQSQSARESLDKHYQEAEVSDATALGETCTAEDWHQHFAAKENRAEVADFDGELRQIGAALAHDWLEMPDTDTD